MNIAAITFVSFLLILFALYVFLKYDDEWVALVVAFFISSGLNRYNVVMDKKSSWVRVAYSKGVDFFKMTDELGLEALNLFLLGTTLLSVSYFFFKNKGQDARSKKIDTPKQLESYLNIHQSSIIVGFIAIFLVNMAAQSVLQSMAQGGGLAIATGGISYFLLFGMALGGMIVLIYLTLQTIDLKKNFFSKILLSVMMVFAIMNSYNASARFQFISWAISIGIIFLKDSKTTKKLFYYLMGGGLIMIVFGIAGVSRSHKLEDMSVSEMIEKAMDRSEKAEDSNMLDGFMMVLQVYPQHLNYQYGLQHLEILIRPIPRALWPDKPPGGYANKLGLNDNMGGSSVGISESIYGTFYGEGAIIGIFVFCILYGYLFNKLFNLSLRYSSSVKHLIKGIILASTIPLMRGGDLPGIIAFVGMTYWPVFLFLYGYNKYLGNENQRKSRINSRLLHQAKLMQQKNELTNNNTSS